MSVSIESDALQPDGTRHGEKQLCTDISPGNVTWQCHLRNFI